MDHCERKPKSDLLSNRWAVFILWVVPLIAILVGGSLPRPLHTALWTLGFSIMAVACGVNARRCGRRHCFYTAPLFFAVALGSLLFGTGLLPLGPHGWGALVAFAVGGWFLSGCVIEPWKGRYLKPK
jgi:peptidoglycan/LPS O-acetylase OafA/YrhL